MVRQGAGDKIAGSPTLFITFSVLQKCCGTASRTGMPAVRRKFSRIGFFPFADQMLLAHAYVNHVPRQN